MNLCKTIMLITVTVVIMGCATTNGQMADQDFAKMCIAIDKNRDGSIDKTEFLADAKNKEEAHRIFLQCDQDKDGLISKEEAEYNKQLMQREVLKRQALRLVGPR